MSNIRKNQRIIGNKIGIILQDVELIDSKEPEYRHKLQRALSIIEHNYTEYEKDDPEFFSYVFDVIYDLTEVTNEFFNDTK